jgi:hypothetical protein
VCGRKGEGSAAAPEQISEAAGVSSDHVVSGESDGAFDDDRELCPDGACIGILGSDGRCKVCGRSAGP